MFSKAIKMEIKQTVAPLTSPMKTDGKTKSDPVWLFIVSRMPESDRKFKSWPTWFDIFDIMP